MRGALRVLLRPTLEPFLAWTPVLFGLSCYNWLHAEAKDELLAVTLFCVGLVSALRIFLTTVYPSYEFLASLPLTRRRGLWLPFALGGTALLVLGMALHIFESTGAAGSVLRFLHDHLRLSTGRDLTPRRRPAVPLAWLLGYPSLGYWAFLGWTTRVRRRNRGHLGPLWGKPLWIVAALSAAIAPLPRLTRALDESGWCAAGVGAIALAVSLWIALRLRTPLTQEPDELSPLSDKGRAVILAARRPDAPTTQGAAQWTS